MPRMREATYGYYVGYVLAFSAASLLSKEGPAAVVAGRNADAQI